MSWIFVILFRIYIGSLAMKLMIEGLHRSKWINRNVCNGGPSKFSSGTPSCKKYIIYTYIYIKKHKGIKKDKKVIIGGAMVTPLPTSSAPLYTLTHWNTKRSYDWRVNSWRNLQIFKIPKPDICVKPVYITMAKGKGFH